MIDSQLIEALSTPEESQRRYAAEEISESGDPEAATLLVSQLHKEGSRAVKEAILRGLSRIWTSNPVDSIIELLKDHDPFVRAEAAGMLQRRAGDVIEGLNRLMRSDDKDLRKFSVDILREATIGAPDALYLAALKDEDINVVISAIENIGSRRRTGLAKPVLAMAMESSQPMAVCASLEALALIGTRQTLDALRAKYPNAAEVPGIYLQPFLKLLGHTAGPESIEEICRTIEQKGEFIYEVAIDALTNIALRHNVSQLNSWCEARLCGLLQPELDAGVRFHLIRLLGHFTGSTRVALVVLPYIHDPDRTLGLAAVESLANSSDPAVESALQSLLSTENDPEIKEELEELLRRRPRWNLPLSSSPN
jgi:HEAT repeat protein